MDYVWCSFINFSHSSLNVLVVYTEKFGDKNTYIKLLFLGQSSEVEVNDKVLPIELKEVYFTTFEEVQVFNNMIETIVGKKHSVTISLDDNTIFFE